MAKFEITCTARATIRETWLVEAENAEAAEELFYEQGKDNGITFVGDEVMGDEEDREVIRVEPAAR